MKAKRIMCMAAMLIGFCGVAMAQKSIDKVAEEMERDADARITSIKKRDPETRKVVKVTKTIRLTSDEFSKRALYAFEKEEENALTSIKEKRSRVEYTLTFRTKVEKRTYILNIREGNDVEISIFITPVSEKDTSWMEDENLYKKSMGKLTADMQKYEETMGELNDLSKRIKVKTDE